MVASHTKYTEIAEYKHSYHGWEVCRLACSGELLRLLGAYGPPADEEHGTRAGTSRGLLLQSPGYERAWLLRNVRLDRSAAAELHRSGTVQRDLFVVRL